MRQVARDAGMVVVDLEQALDRFAPASYIPAFYQDRIHPSKHVLDKLMACIMRVGIAARNVAERHGES